MRGKSGAKTAVDTTTTTTTTTADGYPDTGLLMPHRRRKTKNCPTEKGPQQAPPTPPRPRRHAFAHTKTWTILRDRRLKGDGVHHALLGIARLHHLNLAR